MPIPSLLATAAVHHHLVREQTRTGVGLVVETGEAREVMHLALLIGYGAEAVNPYLAFETIADLARRDLMPPTIDAARAEELYVQALVKGLRKTIARMGISTIQSYCGAQIFECLGIDRNVVDRYFPNTASRIGGIGMDVIAAEAIARHQRAFPDVRITLTDPGGPRRVPLAPRWRAPPVEPRGDRCAPARGQGQRRDRVPRATSRSPTTSRAG